MNLALLVPYAVLQFFQQGGDNGGAVAAGGAISSLCSIVVGIVIGGLLLMGIFRKAGKPTWAAFVPLYNAIVMLDIVGRPVWWFILLLIPFVDLIVGIVLCIDLAKSFGKDTLYGIGLIIPLLNLILLLMLSYGSATYVGPAARSPSPAM